MKHRCMCGKPEGVVVPYPMYPHHWSIHFSKQEPTLHFKPADQECERCGRPLCKDCQSRIQVHSINGATFRAGAYTLCSVCAKEL